MKNEINRATLQSISHGLRRELKTLGLDLKHTAALELIARAAGNKTWNNVPKTKEQRKKSRADLDRDQLSALFKEKDRTIYEAETIGDIRSSSKKLIEQKTAPAPEKDIWDGSDLPSLTRGNVRVEWVDLGERLEGDYDGTDKKDVNLLRFDVSQKNENEWEEVPDGSFCTLIPAHTGEATLKRGLRMIMDDIYDEIRDHGRAKRICESLSHLKIEQIESRVTIKVEIEYHMEPGTVVEKNESGNIIGFKVGGNVLRPIIALESEETGEISVYAEESPITESEILNREIKNE